MDEFAAEKTAGDDLTRYEQSILDRALDKMDPDSGYDEWA